MKVDTCRGTMSHRTGSIEVNNVITIIFVVGGDSVGGGGCVADGGGMTDTFVNDITT